MNSFASCKNVLAFSLCARGVNRHFLVNEYGDFIFWFELSEKAWFKRRILHAPNQISELSACKMRRLKQLNSADLNKMRVQSNIRLFQFHCCS